MKKRLSPVWEVAFLVAINLSKYGVNKNLNRILAAENIEFVGFRHIIKISLDKNKYNI